MRATAATAAADIFTFMPRRFAAVAAATIITTATPNSITTATPSSITTTLWSSLSLKVVVAATTVLATAIVSSSS